MAINEETVHAWTNRIEYFIDNSRKAVGAVILFFFIALFIQAAHNHFSSTSEDVKYLMAVVEKLSNKVDISAASEKNDIFNKSETKLKDLEKEVNQIISKVTNGMSQNERFDFALKGAGGDIISYHDSKLMYDCGMLSILSGFCNEINPPSKAIQSLIEPGEGFCFKGNQGSLTIKLACDVAIDSVTIDHVNQMKAPLDYISEAPKEFSLFALKTFDDPNGVHIGNYIFDPSYSSQTFHIFEKPVDKFRYIRINITGNHGNEEKTCLYRIRVHGFVDKC
ncbi:hypothetical protein PVAND_012317 [Polypedilum vanderplanki]|uniref:SUN domain-containing protein n=1 Tax=Polypedilum vanderplanki TaxID=319348 RepID=A0A9J6CM15_POLVA|nr:hypothetical protein PVAND_012317 [Polypedilum vanderplanki]